MALAPTASRTALKIPGVTDVGPIIAPSSVAMVAPTQVPGSVPAVPIVPPVPTVPAVTTRAGAVETPLAPVTATTSRAGAATAGRSAQTTTVPQITIGDQTFTQGGQVPPGANGVGLFGAKTNGSPQGAPNNPPPRTIWRGPQGVWYAWRPNGPNGDGWYRLGTGYAPSPTEAGVGLPEGSRPPSVDTAPAETAPPVGETPSSAAGETPDATSWSPDPNWWWQRFQETNDYQMTAPQIAAQENQTAAQYGYRINRDARQGSQTFGQAFYRLPNQTEGTGNILAFLVTVPGTTPPEVKYVYRDASGKEYAPGELVMDVVALRPGEAGYAEGSLGRAQMESAAQQSQLGSTMAERGLRRSGIRGVSAIGQVQALLDALNSLGVESGRQFTQAQNRWLDLINRIMPGLAESAQGLYEASVAPPAGGGGGETGDGAGGAQPEEPAAPPAPQRGPSIDVGGMTYGVGDRVASGPDGVGMFSRKVAAPKNAPKKPKNRELWRGPNGVWYAYRPNGQNGAGWYRYVPAAPGAPSPTQAGVTTRT